MQLLVDSGHEDEITSVPVAAQQVEVFTKVLMTTVQRTIDSEPDEWQRNIQELVVCNERAVLFLAPSDYRAKTIDGVSLSLATGLP